MTAAEAPPARHRLVAWWSGLGRGSQVAVGVLAVVVTTNVALAALQSAIGQDPGGPASSPVSTGGDGLAAYADLLARVGHDVSRSGDRLDPGVWSSDATAIVAEPAALGAGERAQLEAFVRRGGHMVLSGPAARPLLADLVGGPVQGRTEVPVDRLAVWLPVDGTGSARSLAGDDGGRWQPTGPLLGVAGSGSASTRPGSAAAVLVAAVGKGQVVAVADTALLQNAHLDEAGNAAFALAAAGPPRRPVVFVEASASAARAEGLAAVPDAWKLAAGGLAVALVVGLWSAASRFGPPEPQRRELRPPRLDHVTAVAADLDRVAPSATEAAAPLAEAARLALAERVGAPADASPAVLYAAASDAGIDPAEVAVLVEPPVDLDAALAVGRAAAARQRSAVGAGPGDPTLGAPL